MSASYGSSNDGPRAGPLKVSTANEEAKVYPHVANVVDVSVVVGLELGANFTFTRPPSIQSSPFYELRILLMEYHFVFLADG